MRYFACLILACIIFFQTLTKKAYAYIDPGTGSYILQLLIGFILGGLFALKLFWTKIRLFFSSLFTKKG